MYNYFMANKNRYLENNLKLQQLEARLNKNSYLSKGALPGQADALIFEALKSAQKIPNKQDYFNFYHWYITMSQFAKKQVSSWKKISNLEINDHPISQAIQAINILKALSDKPANPPEIEVDYLMNIFIKDPVQKNIKAIRNNLDKIKVGKKKFIFEIRKDANSEENKKNGNQLRINFCVSAMHCEQVKKTILKYQEVENIEIGRKMKDKKATKIG